MPALKFHQPGLRPRPHTALLFFDSGEAGIWSPMPQRRRAAERRETSERRARAGNGDRHPPPKKGEEAAVEIVRSDSDLPSRRARLDEGYLLPKPCPPDPQQYPDTLVQGGPAHTSQPIALSVTPINRVRAVYRLDLKPTTTTGSQEVAVPRTSPTEGLGDCPGQISGRSEAEAGDTRRR